MTPRLSTPVERILGNFQRDLDHAAARTSPVAPGTDHVGAPPIAELAVLEEQSHQRRSPRQHRWPDVAKFDERVSEYEARRAGIQARLGALRAELATVDADDAETLAGWIAAGEEGPRPVPTRPQLEAEVGDLEREAAAVGVAVGAELQRKANHVTRHRARLAKDARAHVEGAHARLSVLLSELAEARDELAAARESELWALIYPSPEAGAMPPLDRLAGGSRRVGEQLGVSESIPATRLIER